MAQFIVDGFVKEVFHATTDKDGNVKPVSKHHDYVVFYDRLTGGDVKLIFIPGHGLEVGPEYRVTATVRGRSFGQSIGYEVLRFVADKLGGSAQSKPK